MLQAYKFFFLCSAYAIRFGNASAGDLHIRPSAIEEFAVALTEKHLDWTAAEPQQGRRALDWESQNKIPPWMSHISPGSAQGVGILLGQSLQPDGSPPPVLMARVEMAKQLLKAGNISKVIVSGSDAAGVGKTEAYEMFELLVGAGVPADQIIRESQALTTAENAWFALRWIPKGIGQLHIITSDFHISRATYIFNEVLNFFYKMVEDRYANDPAWKSASKKYPRLEIHQQVAKSFCGSDANQSKDEDPKADINQYSLAKRAMDELGFLGSMEVAKGLFGAPEWIGNQVWPIRIDVQQDTENVRNYAYALAQAENVAQSLCACRSRPDSKANHALAYPLKIPVSETFPNSSSWQNVIAKCRGSYPPQRSDSAIEEKFQNDKISSTRSTQRPMLI